jgi:uncharacterized protein YaiI (UPF0178 family)
LVPELICHCYWQVYIVQGSIRGERALVLTARLADTTSRVSATSLRNTLLPCAGLKSAMLPHRLLFLPCAPTPAHVFQDCLLLRTTEHGERLHEMATKLECTLKQNDGSREKDQRWSEEKAALVKHFKDSLASELAQPVASSNRIIEDLTRQVATLCSLETERNELQESSKVQRQEASDSLQRMQQGHQEVMRDHRLAQEALESTVLSLRHELQVFQERNQAMQNDRTKMRASPRRSREQGIEDGSSDSVSSPERAPAPTKLVLPVHSQQHSPWGDHSTRKRASHKAATTGPVKRHCGIASSMRRNTSGRL